MRTWIFLLFAIPWTISAAVDKEQVMLWQAQSYLQAGDGAKAESLYTTILTNQSIPWKRSILFYNIATTALLMGNNEKAVDLYSQILLGKNPPDFFVRALYGNMAIARWRMVQIPLKAIEEGGGSFPDTYLKAGDLIRLIISEIRIAQKAECAMRKGDCVLSPSLEAVRHAAQERLSWLLLKFQDRRFESLTAEDGIPVLFTGIEELDNNLEAVIDTEGTPDVVRAQGRRIADAALKWMTVWEMIKQKLPELPLFNQARTTFAQVPQVTLSGDLKEARRLLEQARVDLEKVYGRLVAKNPIVESLRRLLSRYDNIRETLSVQESALESLAREQKVIMEKVDAPNSEQLQTAITYIHQGEADAASFYFNIARQEVVHLLWEHEALSVPLPQHLLEMVVEEQRHALILVRISQRAQLPDDAKVYIEEAQKRVTKIADEFYKEAITQQQYDFSHAKDYCQYHPWVEVFPLFFDGDMAARGVLTVGLSRGEDVKSLQDNALGKFNEALTELKKPKSNESCTSSQSEGGGGEGKSSIDEVLRLLQKMEQDDRQQKSKKVAPSSGGGTKAW